MSTHSRAGQEYFSHKRSEGNELAIGPTFRANCLYIVYRSGQSPETFGATSRETIGPTSKFPMSIKSLFFTESY